MKLLRIRAVIAIRPYVVKVTLSNGEVRELDIEQYLSGPAFDEIRTPEYFMQVLVDRGTIGWPNGIQLCPDSLIYSEAQWEEIVKAAKEGDNVQT